MTVHTKVSGTWKEVTGISVNVASTWKTVNSGWTNVSGVWKQFFGTGTELLAAGNGGQVYTTDDLTPWDASVGIRFNTDGTVDAGTETEGGGMVWVSWGNWIVGGTPSSDYSVRYTNLSILSGSAWDVEAEVEDTWIDLGTQRIWTANRGAVGQDRFTCDFEVRITAGAPPATATESYEFWIENTT